MRALQKMKNRKLMFETLEAREMLSVNPLAADWQDDNEAVYEAQAIVAETQGVDVEIPQMLNAEVPRVMNADTAITLSGLTLNITAANYATYNAQYDFNNVTSIANSRITADGVALNFVNCTGLENTNLTAKNGGVIKFQNLTTSTQYDYNYNTWEATGTNSRIEMSALTTINSSFNSFYVKAYEGGTIDLSKLSNLGYYFYVTASDNSVVSLSDLTSTDYLSVNASNGSTIDLSALTNHTDTLSVYSSGTNTNVNISKLTNFNSSSGYGSCFISTSDGGTVTIPENITTLERVNLRISTNLINFDASKITSIKNSYIYAFDGLTLNFSNCTELVDTSLSAQNGGVLDLSKLTAASNLSVYSSGIGSNVNISGLADFSGITGVSLLDGGTITTPNNITSLENVYLSLGANTNFDTSKITSVKNSSISVYDGVTINFVNCTELVDATLTASNGGVIKFPKLTTYFDSNSSFDWSANGNNSRIEMSALTNISSDSLTSYYYSRVYASNGGVVDLSELTTANSISVSSSYGGTVDLSKLTTVSNYFSISSTNANSNVDISSLTELKNHGNLVSNSISTSYDGTVTVSKNITTLENVNLYISTNLINFDASKITSIKNSYIYARDGVTFNFANCTELVDAFLVAQNGGEIKFPKVTTYTKSNYITPDNGDWWATGTKSKIEMSALTTIVY
jgi:hypothetical protein